MLQHSDIEQNDDEWYRMRGGRVTGSKFPTVMANYPDDFGEPAKRYALNIALERITGRAIESTYKNEHMDRGHEQEPLARRAYEDLYFCETKPGGFYHNERIGCSPDFLVYDEGLGEIKSHIPHIHYANVKRGTFDPSYKWQLWGNLKYSGREWIDYISFCADYPPDNQLYVVRIHKADCSKEFGMLDKRIEQFLKLVDECEKNIRGLQNV